MTDATDRAGLIAEAADWIPESYGTPRLIRALAAALAQSERDLAAHEDGLHRAVQSANRLRQKLAEQAAVIEAVRVYADERAWYGQQNRTVGSNRIASDLLAILSRTPTTETTKDGEP